ncbi:molybdopterin-dependent oxidoreductase, partial [Chloroflexota bacterium]
VRATCGMCQSVCPAVFHIKNGKITKVEAESQPLCFKGIASTQLIYHPDRIKYPMKRAGNRGEGKWQRISWDEALDTVATSIKKIRDKDGPLAVATSCGTNRPHLTNLRRFMNIWGTPDRLGYPHNCMTPKLGLMAVIYGASTGTEGAYEHISNDSKCLVTWGYGFEGGRNAAVLNLKNARKAGAKHICIDPYFNIGTSYADLWLQIRPGTDCAMALAWINVIIAEDLYDKEFVEKWTYGFDRLAKHVKPFTPEWAEKVTWVPADKIRQAARMYASTKPALQIIGVSPQMGVNTTNTMHSLYILPALTGNIDIPGGRAFSEPLLPRSYWDEYQCQHNIPKDVWDNHAARQHPLIALGEPTPGHYGWRAILTGQPYPIRALLVHGANPLCGHENPKELVYKALMKLDFVAVMDIFMTPTAELADIVLPASTWAERDEIRGRGATGVGPRLTALQKLIEPLWESKDDVDVFQDVLRRVGLDWGYDSKVEMLDDFLKPLGITYQTLTEKRAITASQPKKWKKYELGLLRPDGKPGFDTSSGKIELYAQMLEKWGIDPLPVHKEPTESPVSSPELMEEYPLVLTTGIRSLVFRHSEYRQLPLFRELHPDPLVRINPVTAEKLGIEDGDWVYIESPRGRCKQKAMLTIGIDPRVVLAEHAWWFPEKPAPEHGVWESNINLLLTSDPPYDPGLGSTPARSLLCKVYKAEEV